MPPLEKIEGKYSGEVFILGNGTTLNQYPDDFLLSRPRFGINFFPMYHDVEATFWSCWDSGPLKEMMPAVLASGVKVILNPKDIEQVKNMGYTGDEFYFWKNTHKHKEFGFTSTNGVSYSSTIHWAAQVSLFLLGFDTCLVLGFDCSTGQGQNEGMGITGNPHFYDPDKENVRHQRTWDKQWASMIKQYQKEERGWSIKNLSVGSLAKDFPAEDWRPYYNA